MKHCQHQAKRCVCCKKKKSLRAFGFDKSSQDGRNKYCRKCCQKFGRQFRMEMTKEVREKRDLQRRNYVKKNKKEVYLNGRKRLCAKYGMTLEGWNQLFEKQDGCCAICGRHQSEFKRVLSIDHNHKTGQVRGLLCDNCNHLLGFMEDDKKLMRKATLYLVKTNNKNIFSRVG